MKMKFKQWNLPLTCQVNSVHNQLRTKVLNVKFQKKVHVQASVNTKTKYSQIYIRKQTFCSSSVQTLKLKESVMKPTCGEILKNRLLGQCNFDKFAEKLSDHEQTNKFVKCIAALETGKLPFHEHGMEVFLRDGFSSVMHINHKYEI